MKADRLLTFCLLGIVALIPGRLAKVLALILGGIAMTSDKAVSVEQRLNAMWVGDTWTKCSKQAGWSQDMWVRYGMDKRHAVVKLSQANPNGNWNENGTKVIYNIPAPYRPKNRTDLTLASDGMDNTSVNPQNPHISIKGTSENNSGDVLVYGVPSFASVVSCVHHYPLFDDP